ncbi:MAG: PAS domain S-box protein [Proteobacteria bacterium]|nr:PAS domain S-box protein [Pseudomonadota bacterium]
MIVDTSKTMDRTGKYYSYIPILLYIILTIGIIAAGYFYYSNQEKNFRAGVESQLSSIADLKVSEIVNWRKERLGDASVYYKNDNFASLVSKYLEKPLDTDAKKRLKTWLSKIRTSYQYNRVFLTDVSGIVRASDPESIEPISPHLLRDITAVLDSGKVTFLGFHRDSPGSPIYQSILVPILYEENGNLPLGVLVFRINPDTYLYPLIQSWPVYSLTAETLLIRRDAGDVLFLNELRFQKKTSLNLRIPINPKSDLPASKAALGIEGIVEGIDYRGVPVVAFVRSIPDSPWFIVSKMDKTEIYAPLKEQLWVIIILIGSLLAGTGIGIGLIWRRRQSRFYQEKYEAAEALRASEDRYRSVLDSMMEGCEIVGFDWRYLYVNEETVRQCRRTKDELLGHTIMDVFPGIKDTKAFAVMKKCMDAGSSVSMENEFTYPDGDKAWFYMSIQPVPEGIFMLSMDITGKKQAEERANHLNAIIKAIRKVNQLITKEKDRDLLVKGACENLVATRGFASAWILLLDSSGKPIHIAESGLGEKFGQLKNFLKRSQFPQCIRKALAQSEVVITTNRPIECSDCPILPIYTGNASFCVKLEYGGKVYGILTDLVPQSFSLDQEEQALFHEVADDIAFGLYNIEQEEKQREIVKELSYSEARYRTLFEGAAEGILIIDMENREFQYANPAICKMLGYTQDELKKMNVMDIHPQNDFDSFIPEFTELERKSGGMVKNIPCIKKDGAIIYADFNTTLTSIDGIPCNVGFITDVTERKKSDDALKESQERFKILFEYAPDAIYLHDLEGRFIDCNLAAEKMIGYSKEELIGKSLAELSLIPQESAEKAAKFLDKNAQGLPAGPEEFITNRKDGKQNYAEFRTFPLEIKGRKMVMGVARDVSERKNLEEQLRQSQKLEAIGILSGGIAHDFNNLLTTIMGNSELILMGLPKGDPLREEIEEIKVAGERAATLTRQLLAFSRKQVLQPAVVNLNEIALDMEKMLCRMIGENIELKTILSPDLGQIEVDESQIEQVIMNLVVNARDAMPEGGKITIETGNINIDEEYANAHVSVKPGSYIMLSISDTGVGIPKENQAHIFEPFYTTKGKGKGTGLGLSTVYGIIKQSNGNIWLYSEPGKGTAFKIYLPRVEKPVSEMERKAKATDSLTGSETILVVEDDEMVINFIIKVLKGYGYKVLTALNGEEAIKVSEDYHGPIHLILTDVIMPGINSRDMEEELKSYRPELSVLYMSGYTDNAIVHHGVLDPGKIFIAKPFSPESLGRKVREVLKKIET